MKRLISKFRSLSRAQKLNLGAILIVLAVTAFTHGFNLFEYPYYENDEATYTSRGWTVLENGELDPYTYRYDHPPGGWLVITGWQLFTGGTLFFGSLLESARVLMLLLAVVSSVLTYLIAFRLTKSKSASLTAVLLLAVSPLAIYFQRRVLLDNIMSFFLLLSLFLATDPKQQLRSYQFSAVTFGLAVLSKLTAVFAGPAILLMVFLNSKKVNRGYVLMQWLAIAGLIASTFLLYAALKGELLPAEIGSDGRPENVSLIDTTREQLDRGEFEAPWSSTSIFWVNVLDWLRRDAVLLVLGFYSIIATFFIGLKRRTYLVLSLYALGFVLFLARGKLVINHYIQPVLPAMALVVAGALASLQHLSQKLVSFEKTRKSLIALSFIAVLGFSLFSGFTTTPFVRNENENLLAAEQWILDNVDETETVITDNYAFPRLRYEEGYSNLYYMFAAEYDPEVQAAYGNDWRNIDYLLVTHEWYRQMKDGNLPQMLEIFENAELVTSFRDGSTSYIDDDNIISTNGDWADIYRINTTDLAEAE